MPKGIPHTTFRRNPLPKDLQRRFDAFVARVGAETAAVELGVSKSTVDKLLYGGSAAPESVARVAMMIIDEEEGDKNHE